MGPEPCSERLRTANKTEAEEVTLVLDYMGLKFESLESTGEQKISGCWLKGLVIILAGDNRQYGWNEGSVSVHAGEGTPKYTRCSFHYRTDVLLSLSDSLHLGEI